MARDSGDWSILGPGESTIATVTFRRDADGPWGSLFTVSGEIYVTWRNEADEQVDPTKKGFALKERIDKPI